MNIIEQNNKLLEQNNILLQEIKANSLRFYSKISSKILSFILFFKREAR